MHRDAESARRGTRPGRVSAVRVDDAFDDGRAEADTCVGGMNALCAVLERLDQCGDELR